MHLSTLTIQKICAITPPRPFSNKVQQNCLIFPILKQATTLFCSLSAVSQLALFMTAWLQNAEIFHNNCSTIRIFFCLCFIMVMAFLYQSANEQTQLLNHKLFAFFCKLNNENKIYHRILTFMFASSYVLFESNSDSYFKITNKKQVKYKGE